MISLIQSLSFLFVLLFASAATVDYMFNVAWMNCNVDGLIIRCVVPSVGLLSLTLADLLSPLMDNGHRQLSEAMSATPST